MKNRITITIEGAAKTGKSAIGQHLRAVLANAGFDVALLDDGMPRPARSQDAALSAARQKSRIDIAVRQLSKEAGA